ncbi:MAG: DUF935 family protein [Pseudomonadota bacterium]|nr:DUF935 family protein [Pseudomonadota bacterium]
MADANDTTAVASKTPPIGEIATVAKDITMPAYGGIMRSSDEVLAAKGAGRGLVIYDDLERDAWLYACMQKRKMAVISRPWTVEPASEKPRDKKAAERVNNQLAALDFDDACYHLLDATLKGYAVAEIMWAVKGGEIVAREIRPKNAHRFLFDDQGGLRLKTPSNTFQGEPVPDRKFLAHRFGAKDGNPHGLGLGQKLWWPVYFKRSGISFWLQFLEKFGAPTVLGKYQPGTNVDELEAALARIAHDAGVAIPEGAAIELIEAQRSGTGTQEQLIRYMDEQIGAAILNDGGAKGSGGELASSAILRNEVRLELVQADSDLLSITLADLARWITYYNDPSANPPRITRTIAEPEDLKIRAERDKILVDMGFKPTLAYIQEHYGGEWELSAPPPPIDPVGRKSAAPSAEPNADLSAEFAEAAAADATPIDPLTQAMSEQAAPAWAAVLDQVRAIVDRAESLEGLRDDLLAAYGDLDATELARVMALGFSVADLAGRYDCHTESNA